MRLTYSLPTLFVFVALSAVVTGCGAGVEGGQAVQAVQAACAARAPTLEASPAQAAPKGPFRLRGEGFFGDFVCDDTGTAGDPVGPSKPWPDESIRVDFVQGDRTRPLVTVGSNENLSFNAGLEVPADARPGPAVVRATGSPSGPSGSLGPKETPFLVLEALPGTGGPREATPSR